MYRGRLWTMRQIAGYGTGADTNARFQYLISQGQTGLSVDFDMPTLMGYDSDHPMSNGEVGREGVAIDTLADMEALFEGIDLTQISVSMTINPTAWILFAMYIALAEKHGYDPGQLSGTIQNDILKEYVAQKEWIYPVRPSMRIVRDTIVYSTRHLPRYNPINISGYHISEAGANAVQEGGFTLANAVAYVEEVVKAGVDVDSFAPRLSFYFVSQADFFEEIAKFRAMRRVYAKIMRERFGAKKPESMRLRFHCQTSAATLTKPQYKVNLLRTAFQALAGVLGGAQSLHTNGFRRGVHYPHRGGDEAGFANAAGHCGRDQHHLGGRPFGRLLFCGEPDHANGTGNFHDPGQSGRHGWRGSGDRGWLVPARNRRHSLSDGAEKGPG